VYAAGEVYAADELKNSDLALPEGVYREAKGVKVMGAAKAANPHSSW
jgi:hypothetical protein